MGSSSLPECTLSLCPNGIQAIMNPITTTPSGSPMALLTPWLLDQIRDGNAILFLGAGATLGAVGPNNETPLNGKELRDRLSDRFLGGDLKDRTLSEVAEYAKNESSMREVQKFIYELFEPLAPAPHHLLIPTFRWHAIITTNYDFLVERAYEKADSPLQDPIRISRDGDADRADFGSPLNVPYLKLHGCLSSISEDSPPLILSTEEYARHRESRERVFGLFADWAQAHPILFCGYKIGDPNIQQILFDLGDGTVNRHPYAVIDPNLVAFDIRYWQSRRFIPQQSSFENFWLSSIARFPDTPDNSPCFVLRTLLLSIHELFVVNHRESCCSILTKNLYMFTKVRPWPRLRLRTSSEA